MTLNLSVYIYIYIYIWYVYIYIYIWYIYVYIYSYKIYILYYQAPKFIVYVAYCIFDMTSSASFLLIKNGSSNYIQLALVTFLLVAPPSSKALNAVNRGIYIYFGLLTKTTIIGHYTVFYGLITILRWLQFI